MAFELAGRVGSYCLPATLHCGEVHQNRLPHLVGELRSVFRSQVPFDLSEQVRHLLNLIQEAPGILLNWAEWFPKGPVMPGQAGAKAIPKFIELTRVGHFTPRQTNPEAPRRDSEPGWALVWLESLQSLQSMPQRGDGYLAAGEGPPQGR